MTQKLSDDVSWRSWEVVSNNLERTNYLSLLSFLNYFKVLQIKWGQSESLQSTYKKISY